MLTFRQFGVGCHVNIAVKLVRRFHFHRSTWLRQSEKHDGGDLISCMVSRHGNRDDWTVFNQHFCLFNEVV